MTMTAQTLIVADLRALRRARARHFMPALVLSLLVVGGLMMLGGLRPDLWQQAPEQIAAQLLVWLLCLVALPAVGLGLWFPSRALRVALGSAAVVAAVVAAIGARALDPFSTVVGRNPPADLCVVGMLGAGIGLLAIGVISGAFAARRQAASIWWVSGGLTLMALDAIVWHCPSDDLTHNLLGHLGAAGLLLMLASGVAWWTHRRQRPGSG